MADLLATYGETVNEDEPISLGDDIIAQYADVPHAEAMQQMRDLVETAIVHFDQLLAVAPEDDVPAVHFLVQHEQALLEFVDVELAEDGRDSLRATQALLGAVVGDDSTTGP